ncbi:hypothetical protein [Geminocystis sp. NIES-3709]|uniref:hypothetical protein n=1 Tax=Geminocystis sp. NIES-3709 TaxID=1617448 RepID=UPI0005FCB665|nr:hypothetical protein [Geminocystis sp. NIES-3709]BAQ63864.1 type IV pilin PilA [Geminocystis sp. NIES-3709]
MSVKQSDYETVLGDYSSRDRIVSLLSQYRQYLEMIPSMRRPRDSVISIPLPLAKVRNLRTVSGDNLSEVCLNEITPIPCDIAVLMCDPEWKIKMGVEILIFIHRPEEDFSNLLRRWRQSQIYLHKEYEWVMPQTEEHMFSDLAEEIHPLFIVFPQTPDRIKKGLSGASLPYIEYSCETITDNNNLHSFVNS